MIGTTRSRVNFFMNKFKKLGFIEYNGGLKVNHSLLTVMSCTTPNAARCSQLGAATPPRAPVLKRTDTASDHCRMLRRA